MSIPQSFKAKPEKPDSFEFENPSDDENKTSMKTYKDLFGRVELLRDEYDDNSKEFNNGLIELLKENPLNEFKKDERFLALMNFIILADDEDPDSKLELCNKLSDSMGVFKGDKQNWEVAWFIIDQLGKIGIMYDENCDEVNFKHDDINDKVNLALGAHLKNCMEKIDLDDSSKLYQIRATSEKIDQNNPGESADIVNNQVREAFEKVVRDFEQLRNASIQVHKTSKALPIEGRENERFLPYSRDGKDLLQYIKATEEELNKNEAIRENAKNPQEELLEYL